MSLLFLKKFVEYDDDDDDDDDFIFYCVTFLRWNHWKYRPRRHACKIFSINRA